MASQIDSRDDPRRARRGGPDRPRRHALPARRTCPARCASRACSCRDKEIGRDHRPLAGPVDEPHYDIGRSSRATRRHGLGRRPGRRGGRPTAAGCRRVDPGVRSCLARRSLQRRLRIGYAQVRPGSSTSSRRVATRGVRRLEARPVLRRDDQATGIAARSGQRRGRRMTTRDQRDAVAPGRRGRRRARGVRRRRRCRSLPERLLRGSRAQGRRPVPGRARHEDPRALPGRARARRLRASCRAPSTPRASCATTRCTSASTPRRSSSSGGASAATSEPAGAGPRRAPAVQAPRQGITFSPAVVVAAAAGRA